jgi:hypothetical protein
MPSLNTKLASAPNTTSNYVLRATSSTTIGNSTIQDDGTNVAIGTTPGTYKLNVSGTFNATGAATFSSSVFSLRNNIGTGTTDDADISLNISAPSGVGKLIMMGRNSSNVAVYSLTSAGAASFSSSVTATEVISIQGTNQNYLRLSPSAGGAGFSLGRSLSNNNAQDFFIYDGIANATRLFINSTGNVGIGTSTTNAKLDVKTSGNGLSYSSAYLSSDSSVYGNALLISHLDGITRIMPTYLGSGIDCNLTFWTTQSNGNQAERMRITAAGKVGMNNGNPPSFLSVGNTGFANAFVYGGHDFHMIRIPVNTWTTFIDVSNNNWAGISELNWVNTVDYNRSGAAYMRWAYNSGTDSLGVVYTLFNNDQNAAAQFRNSGGALQIYITGGGADYYVQFRVMGSRAAP